MSRSTWVGIVILVLVVAVGLWMIAQEFGAVSSTLSCDARGWFAARRYLELRGGRVVLRDEPFEFGDDRGVLVLAFPWQRPLARGELEALAGHLRSGGTVVLAYSREIEQFQELQVLDSLRLDPVDVRPRPPLIPWRWWRYQHELWELEPDPAWEHDPALAAPALAVPALRRAPRAPRRALVLYRGGEKEVPLIFTYRLQRGRVVVVPADLFSNAGLPVAGNADLLESLFGWLGSEWSFDEYHHGLSSAESATASVSHFAWDLFMIHLALIYLLGLMALARRFGPAWREPPVTVGSTASFLRSLGALHRQLHHHRTAAELLVDRACSLDPHLGAVAEPGKPIADGPSLVAFARRISRAQRRRTR